MSKASLPLFEAVSLQQLRQIYRDHHQDEDVKRLALEVARYRQRIAEIDKLFRIIHEAWRKEVGGEMFALFTMKTLLYEEMHRFTDR